MFIFAAGASTNVEVLLEPQKKKVIKVSADRSKNLVGTSELLQIIQQQFSPQGRFWDFVGGLSFNNLGFVIIETFLSGWAVSALIYKWKNYEAV